MNEKRRKVNKYEQIPGAEINLRGLSLEEAKRVLLSFLNGRTNQTVRIITGKGLGSKDGEPVIKNWVIDYLGRQDIRWNYEKVNKGGDGVLVVRV